VSLPGATSIGDGAFAGCTGLTSVSLPEAISIGDETFFGCTSLVSVSLPEATSIGESAFSLTGGRSLVITLGEEPPTVGVDMFKYVTDSKDVTVLIPFDVSDDYNSTWGTGFKGKGWDDDATGLGTVNNKINLDIKTLPEEAEPAA
jgi:hypothetical protein